MNEQIAEVKTFQQVVGEMIDDIERVGLHEALGVAPVRPGMIVDPEKCKCGGGCESLLECQFWYYVRKTAAMERKAARQVKVGRYRVDSLFDCDGKSVVVELDGKQFHNRDDDYRRDMDLLMAVDAVIRIPYAAMTFYPQATFAYLATLYRRFELPQDVFCMTVAEFQQELDRQDYGDGDFRCQAEYVDWAEPNFELWGAFGWIGSPKAWLHKWNVTPIQVRETSDRHRMEHGVR